MRYFISPNALTPVANDFTAEQLFGVMNIYKKIDYDEALGAELRKWLDDPYTLIKHPDKPEHLFRNAKITRYIHTIPLLNVADFSSDMGDSFQRDYVSVWGIFQNNGRLYANIHGLKRELINSMFRKHLIHEILQEI